MRITTQVSGSQTNCELDRRLSEARESVARRDRDPDAYIQAAQSCKRAGLLREALAILGDGIARCTPSQILYDEFIGHLEMSNKTEEAILAAREAARHFPEEIRFRLREALLLPILYDTPEQVLHYRERLAEGLRRFCAEARLDTTSERLRALEAIRKNHIKFMGYQGRNDIELRKEYGDWVYRVVSANFPQFTERLPMPPIPADGALRIGYLSSHYTDSVAMRAFLGWLREHDRRHVYLFAYHAGEHRDATTEQVERMSRGFRQLSKSIEESAATIMRDGLHVLVFLDLGVRPSVTPLAALRLAPIQCMAWDQPVTSGLPTIDYFLSGELMEPVDAQDHYSERLVLLPATGLCYRKPVVPSQILVKRRADFQLREDAVVYLCCQAIRKYLPGQDALFAQIASRVPNSQFVFLEPSEFIRAELELRLGRAFAARRLVASEHCVLLPGQTLLDYWNLNLLADVFLDTIGWSGGVSTFDAVACRLPVVTLPGGLMRGRQSYAILTQMGVTETIASSTSEYVELAVRLGVDGQWKASVIDRMARGHSKLFSDSRCVRALEAFYRMAVEEQTRA